MTDKTSKKLHEEGVALFRQGKLEAALQKLNEAISRADEGSRLAAEIYSDLGVIHKGLEDYPAAHQALDRAGDSFTRLEDKKGQAQVLGNRGAVLEAEGRKEEAVEAYKSSATLLEELGESEMAMYVWQAVSRLRMKQGQYIAAIGAYEEGVENMPKGSFKRKVLQQILKMPGGMLPGGGRSEDKSSPEDE